MRVYILLCLLFLPTTINAATCPAGKYLINSDCVDCPPTNEHGQGYYCPGDDGRYPCPAPFTSSLVGTPTIQGCFAEVQCSNGTDNYIRAGIQNGDAPLFMSPIGNDNQWWGDGTPNENEFHSLYHYEVTGNGSERIFTCQANTVECTQFNNSNCQPLSNLNATWVDDETGGYWNVSLCKCSTDSAVISDKKCTGVQTLSAIEDQTNVTHVGDIIEFDSNPDSYYCTSCIADDASHVYYADTNATGCVQGHVCACAELTTKGWVRTGHCGGNQNWQNQSDICVIQPCPLPGQTTDSIGGQCTYGSATKICDSTDHCVSLPAGNWTAIQ